MDDSRIAELEAKVAGLSSMVERLTTASSPVAVPAAAPEDDVPTTGHSRRRMLALAGGAVAGATALAVATQSSPVAADDPNDLTLGSTKPTTGLTQGRSSSTTAGANAFVFQVGSTYGNSGTFYPAALGGWSREPGMPNGIYGYTESPGAGIVGYGNSGTGIGVLAKGGRSHVYLEPLGIAGPARADAHAIGELIEDTNGDLWLCVAAGTPGTWRKLGGPTAAGSYHAISPVRVYDSRAPSPLQGIITGGTNRTVSVADGRDLVTGAVTSANVVPEGATAVFANVTIDNTVGQGFLAINPGGNTTVAASAINWYASGQTAANGLVLTLNNLRQVTVIAGNGSTNFILDVSGYFL